MRGGLELHEDLHAELVHGLLEFVHILVRSDGGVAQIRVTLQQAAEGAGEVFPRHAGHGEHILAEAVHGGVVSGKDVFVLHVKKGGDGDE